MTTISTHKILMTSDILGVMAEKYIAIYNKLVYNKEIEL